MYNEFWIFFFFQNIITASELGQNHQKVLMHGSIHWRIEGHARNTPPDQNFLIFMQFKELVSKWVFLRKNCNIIHVEMALWTRWHPSLENPESDSECYIFITTNYIISADVITDTQRLWEVNALRRVSICPQGCFYPMMQWQRTPLPLHPIASTSCPLPLITSWDRAPPLVPLHHGIHWKNIYMSY